jgi:hypothetical protein
MPDNLQGSERKPGREEWMDLLRSQLVGSFHDEKVHVTFEKAFAGIPPELRGAKAADQPFTLWRLLEHLRLCVLDFLDYCRKPGYIEPRFPEGYWAETDAPPSDAAWEESLTGCLECMKEFESLILNPATDLFSVIPGTSDRTVLRQALACLDHNGYHLGQVIQLRRLLAIW